MTTTISALLTGFSDHESSDDQEEIELQRKLKEQEECKVWRNAYALIRGPEYFRYKKAKNQDPLTFYDMNLTSQDHQAFFIIDDDTDKEDLKIMNAAWRERETDIRIQYATEALEKNENCAMAMVLLAEEQSETIVDCENMLRKALRSAEIQYKKPPSTSHQYHDGSVEFYRQGANVQSYIRRRLAMCARKQGRLREAIKMFKDCHKELAMQSVYAVQENLIECYLELCSYADVQSLLVRYDGYVADLREPRSAVLVYTSALLKARAVADKLSIEQTRRGLSIAESNAVEAIMRAFEYNPHVPYYLLEMKSMILPPEHYLRRGDSEAICYSFNHLQHWKRIDGALHLLQCTWKGAFPTVARSINMNQYTQYSNTIEQSDRELLPPWHVVSVFPKKESAIMNVLGCFLCLIICVSSVIICHYPATFQEFIQAFQTYCTAVWTSFSNGLAAWIPENVVELLASKSRTDSATVENF
ncbi:hypothetical protein PRIPAC_81536 [Pristionchus pacificus]|nr:hypothetical protein PRIPAC_81536 [Pristionchus pacificus]|eukprot:PDM75406.1 hypothetical protein PRIPAC_42583 [Pristionchus pacificus]